jgi:hypothetical protein
LHADAHELFGQPSDLFVLTDNLSVEIRAGQSPFATEHDEHRLARVARELTALVVAVDPADVAIDRFRRNVVGGDSAYDGECSEE